MGQIFRLVLDGSQVAAKKIDQPGAYYYILEPLGDFPAGTVFIGYDNSHKDKDSPRAVYGCRWLPFVYDPNMD